MGAIQQPTTAMGPYKTEIRRESFYLTVTGPTAELRAERVDRDTMRVPVADVPCILAALDQVTGHLAWREWTGAPRTGTVAVTRDGDSLLIRPGAPVYDQRWDDEQGDDTNVMTEVAYEDVDDLRAQLTEQL
ncbi:hypothetical protein [Streptomyces halobius]|uniref:Uncharacterized protein n=1 Tax=Streptomyces halobius TaxID=2879846 RepID=A0ABY4MCY8_9ACTN|nr:hypothetical protein [Streptomyces halobius]UQA95646.1 hypothetical protein K9S39_30660 [Streptomyces halobius]